MIITAPYPNVGGDNNHFSTLLNKFVFVCDDRTMKSMLKNKDYLYIPIELLKQNTSENI